MKKKRQSDTDALVDTFIWDENVGDAEVDAGGTIRVNPEWWNRLDAVSQKEVLNNWDQFKNRYTLGVYK